MRSITDTDTDADTDTDTAVPLDEDQDGYFDLASGGDDCNDNNYQVYPGAPEACNGVDDDCDGLTDEDFDAVVLGSTASGYFGYAVLYTGDVNGDGSDDLLVTELQGDGTDGRVWLLDGSLALTSSMPDDSALLAWTGEAAGSYAGNALAVGDIDGDGVQDFVIAAYGYSSSGDPDYANGKVYVELSGASPGAGQTLPPYLSEIAGIPKRTGPRPAVPRANRDGRRLRRLARFAALEWRKMTADPGARFAERRDRRG